MIISSANVSTPEGIPVKLNRNIVSAIHNMTDYV